MRTALTICTLVLASCPTGFADAQELSGQPRASTLDFVFEEVVALGADIRMALTSVGVRNIVPITGGTFNDRRLKGTILPGGWDWHLRRADGCLEIKADYMLRTEDGAIINVVNRGVASTPEPGDGAAAMRTMAVLEPPLGKDQWLGKAAFVGTLKPWRTPQGASCPHPLLLEG